MLLKRPLDSDNPTRQRAIVTEMVARLIAADANTRMVSADGKDARDSARDKGYGDLLVNDWILPQPTGHWPR
jgi:uncharacterized membrane protein